MKPPFFYLITILMLFTQAVLSIPNKRSSIPTIQDDLKKVEEIEKELLRRLKVIFGDKFIQPIDCTRKLISILFIQQN